MRRASKKPRDQADQIYNSEWEAFPGRPRQEFTSIRSVRLFVDEVVASPVWRNIGGPGRVEVKDNGDQERSAASSGDEIWIARSMRDRETVLHELAHLAAGVRNGHNKRFAKALLVLISHFMGLHYYDRLIKAYQREQVSY